MSKLITLVMLMLLLTLTLTGYAARPDPIFNQNKHQEVEVDVEGKDDTCEGISNKEECLIRRTLAAHVDYIYTQKHPKPRP